jgi:hypothetical protein
LILSKRYGTKVDYNGMSRISVTHLEFREAKRLLKSSFVYIRDKLYGEYNHLKNNPTSDNFDWCEKQDHEVFDLIDEVKKENGNGEQKWIQIFSTSTDLKRLIKKDLKIASNTIRFESAILENKVPILNGHAEFKKEISRHPDRYIFHLKFKNYGSVPAYNIEIHNEWEPAKIQKKPVLPPGAEMIKQIVARIDGLTVTWIGQFIVKYKLIDGNTIEDTFEVILGYNSQTNETKLEFDLRDKKYLVGNAPAFEFKS